MRHALIIATIAGQKQIVSGPEVPYHEQRRIFKAARFAPPEERAGIEALEFWTDARGRVKIVRFDPSTVLPTDDGDEFDDEPDVQFPNGGSEPPSASGVTDAPGQTVSSAPPLEGEPVVIETEAKIIDGAVALVEVPSEEKAPEAKVNLDDDGPTLDLPPEEAPASPDKKSPEKKSKKS